LCIQGIGKGSGVEMTGRAGRTAKGCTRPRLKCKQQNQRVILASNFLPAYYSEALG
jgi:hypothetical protein